MTREPSMSLHAFSFSFLYPSPTATIPSLSSYSLSSTYNSEEKNTSPCDNVVRFKNERNQPVVRNTRATLRGGALCYAIDSALGKVWQRTAGRQHNNHRRGCWGRYWSGQNPEGQRGDGVFKQVQHHLFKLREDEDTISELQSSGNIRKGDRRGFTTLKVEGRNFSIGGDGEGSIPINKNRKMFLKDFSVYDVTRVFG